MPRITVSFKNNEEELELYKEIKKHSDRSGFIKDILKGNIQCINKSTNKNENDVDRKEEIVDREIKDFNYE